MRNYFKFVLAALLLLLTSDTTIAIDESTTKQGRGRGAGLAERVRQRRQRREDEMNARMQDRRIKIRQNKGGSGESETPRGRGARKKQNVAQKISAPLKKRLEEMRNRRKTADELYGGHIRRFLFYVKYLIDYFFPRMGIVAPPKSDPEYCHEDVTVLI